MFIHIETLQKVTEREMREAHPQVTGPVPYEGYAVLFPAPQPTYDPITQGVREDAPVETNGQWYQGWETFDLEPEQVAANQAAAAQRLQDEVVFNTQKRLDTFARTRNYDGILSACTYASSSVPKFQTEGQYCVDARDNTWATLYTILAEVQAGTRPVPTGFEDIVGDLPVLEWPA
jgi:hypothetical protein